MTAATETSVPIVIRGGADWWIQFAYTAPDGTTPIAVTEPRMEIREGPSSEYERIFSSETDPVTLELTQPQPHIVKAKLASGASANGRRRSGNWDAYATDPDGNTVYLGGGTALIEANVSVL